MVVQARIIMGASFIKKLFFPLPWLAMVERGLLFIKENCAAAFSKEAALGTRFLFYPVFAGGGAVVYFSYHIEPSFIDCCLLLLFAAGICFLARHRWPLYVSALFFLCFSFGFTAAKVETMRMGTTMLGADVTTDITARVISFEKTTNNRFRLLLDVQKTARPKLFHAPERVRLSARNVPNGLAIGDIIQGRALLRAASGPIRLGNYDFSFHDYFRGIGAQGFYFSIPVKIAANAAGGITSLEISVARLRAHITKRITNALPGEEGFIAAALITGQRGGISEQSNEALRISGLSHILSISGLHMAMVTGMVLVVFRSFFALFPVWSSRFSAKKIAAFIALLVSGFYLLLSGADVAAQRSFIMVAVMLIAILANRTALTMHNLAIAALVSIAFVPHEIVGPSFQMSYAATAALIAAFSWWSKRQRMHSHRQGVPSFVGGGMVRLIVFPVVSTAVASLVAGGASGIFSAYQFSNTAPLGIISNAAAFPVMSLIVMPFALFVAVLMPFGLEWTPLQIMGWGVKLVLKIAFWVSDLSPDFNPGLITNNALVMMSIGLIVLLFMQTWLRLTGVLLFAAGLMMVIGQKPPSVIISEDGRLAAAMVTQGEMAISRNRPNRFILENWRKAYRVKSFIAPSNTEEGRGFICTVNGCRARLENGDIFIIITTPVHSEMACKNAQIAFLDFVEYRKVNCAAKIVITRRALALYGAAEMTESGQLHWAVGAPLRPWNRQRIYSRQARGF